MPRLTRGAPGVSAGRRPEVVGSLTNQDRLHEAGQVQQEKGTERIKAVQAQVEADAHEAKASSAGRAQKSAQKSKETVNDWWASARASRARSRRRPATPVDNDELQAEGRPSRTKGNEEARESKDRAEAKAHEERAEALDEEQQAIEDN